MGLKTAGVGHIQIPGAPAAGVSITSGSANVYTTTAIAIGTTPSAVFITGIHVEAAAAMAATYISVQLMVGANVIGQYLVPLSTGSTVALGFRPIYPFIPVATATSITAKTADSVGSKATLVSLEVIAQSNVVDDAIPVTTVTNLTNAPTAGDFTTAMKTSLSAATPTVSLAASQHVIVDSGTVTTLTNLPAITAGWLTATGIAAAALNDKGNWNIGKTGYALTQTFPTNFSALSISAGGLVDILQTAADKTWGTAARTLTAGTNIALAKGTGITGFNDIAATDVWGAVARTITGTVTLAAATHTGAVIPTVSTLTGHTAQTGDNFARIGAAGAGLTALGDTRIANLDATVSSRSTYAGGAVASVTGAVGSVTGLTAADVGSIKTTLGAAGAGLTALGDTRIANLDATVSSRSTLAAGAAMTLTAGYDAAKTAAQAGNAMTLTAAYDASKTAATQASVNSIPTTPLLAASYTAPDNASVALIKAKTDNLPATPADETLIIAATDAVMSRIGIAGAGLTALGDTRLAHLDADVSTRLAATGYTAPDNASITAIKAKTDSLNFSVAGYADVNMKVVNGVALHGTGAAGDLFGV